MTQIIAPDHDWSDLLARLSSIPDLDALARETGAFTRRREIRNVVDLLRLALAYGPAGLSLRDTACWATSCGIGSLSDVAVLQRLRRAGPWLERIIGRLIDSKSHGRSLSRRPLVLIDGTIISTPGPKHSQNWRVHAAYEASGASFNALEAADMSIGECLTRVPVVPGAIHIADRGYTKFRGLRHIADGHGDFIVRTGWRAMTLSYPSGIPFSFEAAFKTVTQSRPADISLIIPGRKELDTLPVRLVIVKKPDEDAARERRRVRRRASKSGKKMQPMSLISSDFMMYLTSLPATKYDAHAIADLYRIRWQIELAFKRMKSLMGMARAPAKDPALLRTWIASHLIVALLTEQIRAEVEDTLPESLTAHSLVWRLTKLIHQSVVAAILGARSLIQTLRKDLANLRRLREPPRRRSLQMDPHRC